MYIDSYLTQRLLVCGGLRLLTQADFTYLLTLCTKLIWLRCATLKHGADTCTISKILEFVDP